MDKEKKIGAFSYFMDSERVIELEEKLFTKSFLNLIIDARKGDQDAIIYLVAKSIKKIRTGFLSNKEMSKDDHVFLSTFFRSILASTKRRSGPFYTVDLIDGTREDQFDQLGIEMYTFSKNLSTSSEYGSDPFPEEQETHDLLKETGLMSYLRSRKPEYADILTYMCHYTPSDEIVMELGLTSTHSLESKIRAIRELVDEYMKKEDRRDDNYLLAV